MTRVIDLNAVSRLKPAPSAGVQGVGAGAAKRASAPLTPGEPQTLEGRGARVASPRAPLAPSMGQRSDKPDSTWHVDPPGGAPPNPMDDRRFRMLRWAWRWRADYHPHGWRYARLWETQLREIEGVRLC